MVAPKNVSHEVLHVQFLLSHVELSFLSCIVRGYCRKKKNLTEPQSYKSRIEREEWKIGEKN